jgi:hypothetical protein
MPRFDWRDDEQREEFIGILGAFQDSIGSAFDMPRLDSQEMAFRCYCGTGGLIGYLTKFLRQAVWNALDAESKTIGLAGLLKAHDEAVWAKDGLVSFQSPFAKGFSTTPTDDLIARIKRIGTPADELPAPAQRRKRAPGVPGLQAVLSAS